MDPFGSLSAMYSFKTSSSLWGIHRRKEDRQISPLVEVEQGC